MQSMVYHQPWNAKTKGFLPIYESFVSPQTIANIQNVLIESLYTLKSIGKCKRSALLTKNKPEIDVILSCLKRGEKEQDQYVRVPSGNLITNPFQTPVRRFDHWAIVGSRQYTAISRKVVGKNVHTTIPKGNMGYDQYAVESSIAAFF